MKRDGVSVGFVVIESLLLLGAAVMILGVDAVLRFLEWVPELNVLGGFAAILVLGGGFWWYTERREG